MNGRVYVQKGERFGWVKRDPKSVIPNSTKDVRLTSNVYDSLVFDVDNPSGFRLLNSLLEDGYVVVVGDTFIHNKVAAPSASPFSPIV
jgi:hypothetical protein